MQITAQRRIGLIIGLILGVGYSVTSNLINLWVMPDIPFQETLLSRSVLIVVSTAFFSVLGLLAAWTDEITPSIILSAVVGTLASSIWTLVFESGSRIGASFFILFFIFLPRVFFYLPFSWLVRWLIDKFTHHAYGARVPLIKKITPVFVSFVIIVFIGSLARVSEAEQKSLIRMKELIEEGLPASSRTELPDALQDVEGFVQRAEGEYSFSLGADPDVLPVQRPFVQYGEEEPFIIVQFENGFRFGCVFSPPYIMPACIDY
ncbi:MAG: hypothetical protein JNJ43_12540 [Anaerolineales bacterium]|nr:hypothetical protein [Anaerolineales bacterium]